VSAQAAGHHWRDRWGLVVSTCPSCQQSVVVHSADNITTVNYSTFLNQNQCHKYFGPPYCRTDMYAGMLPPGESWWVCQRDRQTDARPITLCFLLDMANALMQKCMSTSYVSWYNYFEVTGVHWWQISQTTRQWIRLWLGRPPCPPPVLTPRKPRPWHGSVAAPLAWPRCPRSCWAPCEPRKPRLWLNKFTN